jgi:hypothetical protein
MRNFVARGAILAFPGRPAEIFLTGPIAVAGLWETAYISRPLCGRTALAIRRSPSEFRRHPRVFEMNCAYFGRLGNVVWWSAAIFAFVLCNHSLAAGDHEIAAHQARLRLGEMPNDAEQVLAVQKRLVAAKSQASEAAAPEVVLVGQIGGMPNVWPETHPDFPWYKGQASFFLVDAKIASQFATHAKAHGGNHNCSFCQSMARKNANAIAVVNLVDEQGKTLRIDARELLDVKESQKVAVRGKAKLLGGRLLVIDADGVHVPRQLPSGR